MARAFAMVVGLAAHIGCVRASVSNSPEADMSKEWSLKTQLDAMTRETPRRVARNSGESRCPCAAIANPPAVVMMLPNTIPGFVTEK